VVPHAPPAALSRLADDLPAVARVLVAAALVALYARAFVVAAAVVPTASMAPALLAGDRVLVDRMLYADGAPRALARLLPVRAPWRGDVVWLRSPLDPRVTLVKRVAALAGEPFAGAPLPPEHFAVLGDRRAESLDSRRFGPVADSALGGRVCLVLWSADAAGRWRRDRWLVPVR
jgi:signal peptidase I